MRRYTRDAQRFLDLSSLPGNEMGSKQLESYVSLLQNQAYTKRYINAQLRAIRHYLDHLKAQGLREDNPAEHFYLRGVPKPRVRDLLSMDELEEVLALYQNAYPNEGQKQIMLSLMVYQGASKSDLESLETGHIDLRNTQIHFPGSRRTQARSLEIVASQILSFHEYLQERSLGKLFAQGYHLQNQLAWLIKGQLVQLESPADQISKAHQIRASVIAHWLKNEDLRRVQYKAGHKYISSTEYYQQNNLRTLGESLDKYHPFNRS